MRCNATDTRALTALPAETVYHSHHLAEMHAHLTKNHRLRAHQTPPVAHTRQKALATASTAQVTGSTSE